MPTFHQSGTKVGIFIFIFIWIKNNFFVHIKEDMIFIKI